MTVKVVKYHGVLVAEHLPNELAEQAARRGLGTYDREHQLLILRPGARLPYAWLVISRKLGEKKRREKEVEDERL